MFCTWPQIQMKRLFLQFIEKKLTSLDKSPPLTTTKHWTPPFCSISPLFNWLQVLPHTTDGAKLFLKNFSKNSNLDDSGISLPVFPSRTNLKLHISITTKTIKKVITNLDFSRFVFHWWLIVFQWWFKRVVGLNFHIY